MPHFQWLAVATSRRMASSVSTRVLVGVGLGSLALLLVLAPILLGD